MTVFSRITQNLSIFTIFLASSTNLVHGSSYYEYSNTDDKVIEDLFTPIGVNNNNFNHEEIDNVKYNDYDDEKYDVSFDQQIYELQNSNFVLNQVNLSNSNDISSPISLKSQSTENNNNQYKAKEKKKRRSFVTTNKNSKNNNTKQINIPNLGKKSKSVGYQVNINHQQVKHQNLRKALSFNENEHYHDNYFIGDYSKKMKYTYKYELVNNNCKQGLHEIEKLLPDIAQSSASYIDEQKYENMMLLYFVLSFSKKKNKVVPNQYLGKDGIALPTSPPNNAITTRKIKRYIISNTGTASEGLLSNYVHNFYFHFAQTTRHHCIVALMEFIQILNEKKRNTTIEVEILYSHYPICPTCYWLAENLLGDKYKQNHKEKKLVPFKLSEEGCQNLRFSPLKGLAKKFINPKVKSIIMNTEDTLGIIAQIPDPLYKENNSNNNEKKDSKENQLLKTENELLKEINILNTHMDVVRSHFYDLEEQLKKKSNQNK